MREHLGDDFVMPLLDNETRWGSKYAMLKRYLRLKFFIDSLPAAAITTELMGLWIGEETHANIVALCEDLAELDVITKLMQAKSLDLSLARAFFDGILAYKGGKFQSKMEKYLSAESVFIPNRVFQQAAVKIING